MENIQIDIWKLWFQDIDSKQWFQKNDEFDVMLRDRFLQHHEKAMQGDYDHWMDDAKGCLSLVVLLDQFSRNIFRGTCNMFASDKKALEMAKHLINEGYDDLFNLHEKVFAYLPFEHSENLKDQEKSLMLFGALGENGKSFHSYAQAHYDVIKEYGRFPHRNVLLGRESTSEELVYLSDPNSGF